ncbi:hypothetical protein MYU51_009703 [Penicillium brevicompactum]
MNDNYRSVSSHAQNLLFCLSRILKRCKQDGTGSIRTESYFPETSTKAKEERESGGPGFHNDQIYQASKEAQAIKKVNKLTRSKHTPRPEKPTETEKRDQSEKPAESKKRSQSDKLTEPDKRAQSKGSNTSKKPNETDKPIEPKKRAQSERSKESEQPKSPSQKPKNMVTSHQAQDSFHGFIASARYIQATDLASLIHTAPYPSQVSKRLVIFTSFSTRFYLGAVGFVWQTTPGLQEYEGGGNFFPRNTHSTSALGMFGIACAMRWAVEEFQKAEEDTIYRRLLFAEPKIFSAQPRRTGSHGHNMKKELLLFTSDPSTLELLDGKLHYNANGDIGTLVHQVCQLSQILHHQGVHIELHANSGPKETLGEEAATNMALLHWQELQRLTSRSRTITDRVEQLIRTERVQMCPCQKATKTKSTLETPWLKDRRMPLSLDSISSLERPLQFFS